MWYVADGKVDYGYTGTVEYLDRTFEVAGGKIDSELSCVSTDGEMLDVARQEPYIVYDNSHLVYSRNESKYETWEQDFTTSEKGLYRFSVYVNTGFGYNNRIAYILKIVDKFDEQIANSIEGKVNNDNEFDYCSEDLLLMGNERYTIVDQTKTWIAGESTGGECGVQIAFLKPYVNLSGVTQVNDSFGENTITVGYLEEGTIVDLASYIFEPSTTGTYNLWIDNIQISKDMESYSKNNLFDISIYTTDNSAPIAFKEIYVNGEDTNISFECEAGETYEIRLGAEYWNSEKYRNGDVSYSLHIEENSNVNITGYTAVKDEIKCAGLQNTYTIVPLKKQTIEFEFTEMKDTAKVNIDIMDSSGNVIATYENLGNGDTVLLKDVIQANTYTMKVTGIEKTEYQMLIKYE